MLLAQQLSARPSLVSVASEEGMFSMQTQPLPSDFGFVPAFKVKKMKSNRINFSYLFHIILMNAISTQNPIPSSRASSITGPPTSRRSSHHMILEPVKVVILCFTV